MKRLTLFVTIIWFCFTIFSGAEAQLRKRQKAPATKPTQPEKNAEQPKKEQPAANAPIKAEQLPFPQQDKDRIALASRPTLTYTMSSPLPSTPFSIHNALDIAYTTPPGWEEREVDLRQEYVYAIDRSVVDPTTGASGRETGTQTTIYHGSVVIKPGQQRTSVGLTLTGGGGRKELKIYFVDQKDHSKVLSNSVNVRVEVNIEQ